MRLLISPHFQTCPKNNISLYNHSLKPVLKTTFLKTFLELCYITLLEITTFSVEKTKQKEKKKDAII